MSPVAAAATPRMTGPLPTLESLFAGARDLPALPDVAVQVARLAQDPSASAAGIARVIANDQGLTARILRLANSALYGLSRRVGTVQEAVVILGLGTIRSLTLAASIYPALGAETPGYALGKGDLWRHSVASAVCAQQLARGARPVSGTAVDPEEAFVAGLLHDIGKTLLSTCVPDYLPLVREHALAQEMPFAEAERLLLGFDHAQAGAGLAERWKLPPGLVHAIACHHDPLAAAGTPADRDLACIAHVAEALCLMLGIGVGSDGLLFALQPEALDLLGIQGRQDALLSEFLEALGRVGPAFDFAAGS